MDFVISYRSVDFYEHFMDTRKSWTEFHGNDIIVISFRHDFLIYFPFPLWNSLIGTLYLYSVKLANNDIHNHTVKFAALHMFRKNPGVRKAHICIRRSRKTWDNVEVQKSRSMLYTNVPIFLYWPKKHVCLVLIYRFYERH